MAMAEHKSNPHHTRYRGFQASTASMEKLDYEEGGHYRV